MPNPTDTMQQITTVLTFIMLISNFILMLVMWVDKARTPEKTQNDRIERLEERMDELESQRKSEKTKIMELEQGGVVTQEALLALLSHSIDGNHTEGLIKARDSLEKYLTRKGVPVSA